jgi:hypothetical protein
MTLTADPPTMTVGTTTGIGGRLMSGGLGVGGVTLTVSRTAAGASPSALAPVTTRSDGTFVFTDAPAVGSWTYTARWSGDATRAGTSATTNVTVNAPGTKLVLSVQRGTAVGSVLGTLLLSYADGSSANAKTVALSRTVNGGTDLLPSVVTDANGGAKFTDAPPAGLVTYTASIGSDGIHPAATATASITALATTSLTANSPATAWAGDSVTVNGILSAGTSPVSGAGISVFRSGCTTSGSTLTATTTPNGAWSVTDFPPVGSCTYTASYAGGNGYNAATASTQTVVSKRATDLTLAVARGTGSSKKLYTVTAHLGVTHTNRTVTITATSGGTTTTLASGSVDSAGNLTATYQPKTTTTYRATFSGDDWYLSATAERTV